MTVEVNVYWTHVHLCSNTYLLISCLYNYSFPSHNNDTRYVLLYIFLYFTNDKMKTQKDKATLLVKGKV